MSENQEYHNSLSDSEDEKQQPQEETWTHTLLTPFIYLYLFLEMLVSPLFHVKNGVNEVLGWIPLPVFNPKALFIWKFPFSLMTARDLNWRYWITLFTLGYITFYQGMMGWYFQRSINYIREACYCDLIRISTSSSVLEGSWLLLFTHHKQQQLKYFGRKLVCAFFKLI